MLNKWSKLTPRRVAFAAAVAFALDFPPFLGLESVQISDQYLVVHKRLREVMAALSGAEGI